MCTVLECCIVVKILTGVVLLNGYIVHLNGHNSKMYYRFPLSGFTIVSLSVAPSVFCIVLLLAASASKNTVLNYTVRPFSHRYSDDACRCNFPCSNCMVINTTQRITSKTKGKQHY